MQHPLVTEATVARPMPTPAHSPLEPRQFRQAMGRFATGVTVITYRAGGQPAGMTANAFLSVSLEPPLVLVSARRASRLAASLALGDCYGVSVLAAHQQAVSAHFGGRPIEGFAPPFSTDEPVPLIEGALTQLLAEVVDLHEAGDHLLCIGQVRQLRLGPAAAPLLFSGGQYRELLPPPPATCWHSPDGW